ncbi:MAG: enoyl-CoA hydratase/isomerase family protein [Waddliaceae bacterium]
MSTIIENRVMPGVVSLTLNRPEKRNALNIEMVSALCDKIDALNEDETCRVIILKGSQELFCAGLDLKEALDHSNADKSAGLIARLLQTMWRLNPVTIATVHGAAIGGGAGLMAACDFVLIEEQAKIGFPEITRGLVAALIMTVIKRQVPLRKMRELLLLGNIIDPVEAKEVGLVNQVVKSGEMESKLKQLVDQLLSLPHHATTVTKRLMHSLDPSSIPRDMDVALEQHREVRYSDEAQEGIQAFLEGRPPVWKK